eukprot:161299-Chlamydomonas_euryale.AAC.3
MHQLTGHTRRPTLVHTNKCGQQLAPPSPIRLAVQSAREAAMRRRGEIDAERRARADLAYRQRLEEDKLRAVRNRRGCALLQ